MDPAGRDPRVGLRHDLPAVVPGGVEERGGVAASGVGDRGGRVECFEEREDRLGVPLLVEHVGGEDEVERAERDEAFGLAPVARSRRSPSTPLRAAFRSRSAIASLDQSVATTSAPSRAATRDGRPSPQPSSSTRVRGIERGDVLREREAARPALGPVREELVVGERGPRR